MYERKKFKTVICFYRFYRFFNFKKGSNVYAKVIIFISETDYLQENICRVLAFSLFLFLVEGGRNNECYLNFHFEKSFYSVFEP